MSYYRGDALEDAYTYVPPLGYSGEASLEDLARIGITPQNFPGGQGSPILGAISFLAPFLMPSIRAAVPQNVQQVVETAKTAIEKVSAIGGGLRATTEETTTGAGPSGATTIGGTGSLESRISDLISQLKSGTGFLPVGPQVGPETPDLLSRARPGSALQALRQGARRSPAARLRASARPSSKPPSLSSAQARVLARQLRKPRGFTA